MLKLLVNLCQNMRLEKDLVTKLGEDTQQIRGSERLTEVSEDVVQESVIYTCQIPDYFGLIKCSTHTLQVQTSKEFIPRLHILNPSVQNLVNLARMGRLSKSTSRVETHIHSLDSWAIIPILQLIPLCQVPYVERWCK